MDVMIDPVCPSADDSALNNKLEEYGINGGLTAPSIVKWAENWMKLTGLTRDKFKKHLASLLPEWRDGLRRISYVGDGSIDMVPVENTECQKP